MSDEASGCEQDSKAIFDASPEVDRRGFLKVLRWAGDFADLEVKHHGLRNHLVVEDKIIGVLE